MICPECGLDNPDDGANCTRCGASLRGEDAATPTPAAGEREHDETVALPDAGSLDDGSSDATVALPDAGAPDDGSSDPTVALPGGVAPNDGWSDPTVALPDAPTPIEREGSPGTAGWSVPAQPIDLESSSTGYAPLAIGVLLAERYRIVKLLGEGGMGAVYRAEDIELDRPVALKVIRPEVAANPVILQRFKQELIMAREVTHPNVVRIFDLGTSDGIKFITMELVEGRDLKHMIVEGHRFSPDEIVDIIQQICRALQAAHEAGIVHRDLKPQNVMLDSQGQAKVMDFGVARSMETTGLTQTGQMIGTPAYMSPEQAMGESVDARSDLFSLGIILYEMLVGEVPYHSDTAYGTILKRTQEPPVPPIKRKPEVPDLLNDVAVKCLQIERDLRYQSVQEILEDLGTGQAPQMPSALTRLRYKLRRSKPATRIMIGGLTVALAALAVLTITGRWSDAPAPAAQVEIEPVSLAILPFRNSTGNPDIDWLQSSVAEMLRSDIGQSARLRTVPSDRVHQILSDLKLDVGASLDAATIRRLAAHSNAGLVLSGQYSKLGDTIRIDAVLHDLEGQRTIPVKAEAASETELLAAIGTLAESVRENMDLSSDAIRELEATAFAPSTESIEALRHYNEGLQFERQGNYVEALSALERSVEADARFALAHAKLGEIYVSLGRDGDAERASRTALDLSEDLPEYERYLIGASYAMVLNDHDQAIAAYERLAQAAPEDPQINFHLADLYEQIGDLDKARQRLDKVLAGDPNYVDALYALGRVSIRSGDPQAALDPLNRALSLTVQAGNEDGRGRMLHGIGVAYKLLGRPQDALRYYRDALAIRRALDQKSGMAMSLGEIASVQQAQGDFDEARESLEAALELRREIGDRAGIGQSLLGLGDFHLDLGLYDDALQHYKDSLRIQREIGDARNEALCLHNIGAVYLDRGDFSDALTYLEQALRQREQMGIAYELGETLYNLGETASALGQYDQALDYYLRGLEQMREAQDDLAIAAAQHGIAVILGHQGRFRASLESAQEALEALEKTGDQGYWRLVVVARHGATLGAAGRFDEARNVLDGAAKLAEDLQNQTLLAQVSTSQGENLLHQGQLEQAAARFDAALSQATAAGDRRARFAPQLGLARIALARDRAETAADMAESVQRDANELGLKYVVAEATVLLGEALLEQGDLAGARNRAQGELTNLERSKLRPLLARCRLLLGRIDRVEGDEDGADRHYAQAERLLEEIREEGGEDDPFRREDLRSLYSEVSAVSADPE
jgi:serine/threonine protein kinase/tetratricopeptide (TPR) repeat protein